MRRVIVNDYVDAGLTAIFIVVVLAMIVAGVATIRKAMADPNASTRETGNDLPGMQPLKA
jgi:carbon starvation protein